MRLSQPNGAGWALEMDLHGKSLEQCFRPSDGDSGQNCKPVWKAWAENCLPIQIWAMAKPMPTVIDRESP